MEQGRDTFNGLSNFDERLDEMVKECKIIPDVLHFECHPYCGRYDLRKKLKNIGLLLKVGILLVMEIKLLLIMK